jgi:hypothetical protein
MARKFYANKSRLFFELQYGKKNKKFNGRELSELPGTEKPEWEILQRGEN